MHAQKIRSPFALLILMSSLLSLTAVARAVTDKDLNAMGVFSVKQYGAVGDGVADDTAAIQAAIDDSQTSETVILFPPGRYLVSDTLVSRIDVMPEMKRGRYMATQMFGSSKAERPVIQLKDNAPGFNDADNPKPILYMIARRPDENGVLQEDGSVTFQTGIQNLEIRTGKGNSGAIGLDLQGSQGCFIEDVKIDMTDGGWSGLNDLCGQQGSLANIEIVGGSHGITGQWGKYPGYTGVRLINQTGAAIYNYSSQPLLLTGFMIRKDTAPAIVTKGGNNYSSGDITLIDGSIEFARDNGSPAIDNSSGQTFIMRNVYVSNVNQIVKSGENPVEVLGEPAGWKHVTEYVYPQDGPGTNMVDGVINTQPYRTFEESSTAPPKDLITKHLWNSTTQRFLTADDIFDRIEAGDTTMAIATQSDKGHPVMRYATFNQLGASEGVDCTDEFQALIDFNNGQYKTILLPKGQYLISAPITLGAETKLLGVGNSRSIIATHKDWKTTERTDVIRTVDSATATTMLAHLEIMYKTAPPEEDHFTALRWRAGRHSLTRAVWPRPSGGGGGTQRGNDNYELWFSGNAGGKHYGIGLGPNTPTYTPNHRRLYIDQTHEPLHFYNVNVEDGHGDAQGEIYKSRNVVIYGIKSEDDNGMLYNSSNNCALFNYGAKTMVKLVGDCNDILMYELGPKFNSGRWESHLLLLSETFTGNSPNPLSIPLENHVVAVYKRGTFDWGAVDIAHAP